MAYCVVKESNGYSYKGSGGVDDLGKKIEECNAQNHKIRVIAVGPDDHYAVIFGRNGWSGRGPQNFYDKMRAIDLDEVRQISFGPHDTWAIVMNSGFCHAHTWRGPDGPLHVINEQQNRINFVDFTDEKSEWIVGYGNNGWKSRGMKSEMIEHMGCITILDGTVASVTLGKDAAHWIVTTQSGESLWYFTKDSPFHEKVYLGITYHEDDARLRVLR